MKNLGLQYIVEYYGCDRHILSKVNLIKVRMVEAALEGGANIVAKKFKQFDPWGVSGMLIVSESHVSIHTWPEYEYAAVDIFTCGTEMNCEAIERGLLRRLKAERCERLVLKRPIQL